MCRSMDKTTMRYGKKEMTQQEEIIQYCRNYKKDVKIKEGNRSGHFEITFPQNPRIKVLAKVIIDLEHGGHLFVNNKSVEGMKLADIISWLFKLKLIYYDPEDEENCYDPEEESN